MHFSTSEDTAFHTCSPQQMQLCMASFNTLLRGRGGHGSAYMAELLEDEIKT